MEFQKEKEWMVSEPFYIGPDMDKFSNCKHEWEEKFGAGIPLPKLVASVEKCKNCDAMRAKYKEN